MRMKSMGKVLVMEGWIRAYFFVVIWVIISRIPWIILLWIVFISVIVVMKI